MIWAEEQKRKLEEWAKEEERRLQEAWDRFIEAYKKWEDTEPKRKDYDDEKKYQWDLEDHIKDRPEWTDYLDLESVPLPLEYEIQVDEEGSTYIDKDRWELKGVIYHHRIVDEDGEIVGHIYEDYDPYNNVYISVEFEE